MEAKLEQAKKMANTSKSLASSGEAGSPIEDPDRELFNSLKKASGGLNIFQEATE